MRRDWRVIRKILIDIEEEHLGSEHDKVTEFHVDLLTSAGFIRDSYVNKRLTWIGCDLADQLRDAAALDMALWKLDSNGLGHCSFWLFPLLEGATVRKHALREIDKLEEQRSELSEKIGKTREAFGLT